MNSSSVYMRNLPITPGYNGYIPLRFNRMGASYNSDTTYCLKTFNDATQRYKNELDALRYKAATNSKLKEVSSKETVLRMIHDYYVQNHPYQIEAKNIRKPLTEPPIPGWGGYMPRARVTELGCAARYNVMAKQSYEDFINIIETHKNAPFRLYKSLTGNQPHETPQQSSKSFKETEIKKQYEDTFRRPYGNGFGSPSFCACPAQYQGPCRARKYFQPRHNMDYAGG